jgi:subtilisin family serine protease
MTNTMKRRIHHFFVVQVLLSIAHLNLMASGQGQPVPKEVIREALNLKARYHYLVTQELPRRRRLGLSVEEDLWEEHLFRPLQLQADSTENTTSSSSSVVTRQVTLQGSAKPVFFCSKCTAATQKEQEDCARCKGHIYMQQEEIKTAISDLFPSKATVVASTQRLMNALFVDLKISPQDDVADIDFMLSRIPGVVSVELSYDFELQETDAVLYMGGGPSLAQQFCGVEGKGVKVAVLDSGIDYTHKKIGGPGTVEAYALAYGTGPDSFENKERNPEVFPTERVYDGKDFLGESFVHTAESMRQDARPDNNPIDANKHGTYVAHAILGVAPQSQLLACKVCTSDTGTCPGFAVVQALEYALDPDGDDNTDDKVDIINLSLGGAYLSSYYDLRTKALENIFELGVLPVVASGNELNIPYITGPGAKTPNALSVGATGHPNSDYYNRMAVYSSRGPGDKNVLKPDISAPSGLTLAAVGTGTRSHAKVEGTSFAAPMAAGGAALVKERCPTCSPFALKSILMNNARRHVQYHTPQGEPPTESSSSGGNSSDAASNLPTNDDAPNSLVGAGEMQLHKALDSDIWAYCVDDVQPSLSFGLINADKEIRLSKTVKVINLSGLEQNLSIRNEFLSKLLPVDVQQENPMTLLFEPQEQVLGAGCNSEVFFNVTLVVDATKAPPNFMSSAGPASSDPTISLDFNEFGGHVIIENSDLQKDISLPYMTIIRQSAHMTIENSIITEFTGGKTEFPIGLTNNGSGRCSAIFVYSCVCVLSRCLHWVSFLFAMSKKHANLDHS